jgi:hypothetical protein
VLLFPIFKKLKSYNRKVVNNTSIRASVIVNWLKHYNIREVQELAGHRHICSTESYKQDDLENLQKVVALPPDKLIGLGTANCDLQIIIYFYQHNPYLK